MVKQGDLALTVLSAEREQVLHSSYRPWFKNSPTPAPITMRDMSWEEVKRQFAEEIHAELLSRQVKLIIRV